jgi:hypothetical protein
MINEAKYPDRDGSLIYDHLRHYCSKFRPLPAATITFDGPSPVVIQGHKFVRAALDLGIDRMRVIVAGHREGNQAANFSRRPDVICVDWRTIEQEEADTSVLDAWHVFFLEKRLSADTTRRFEERIAGFFRDVQSELLVGKARKVPEVTVSHEKRCAEFIATTPAGDPSWFPAFHARCADFSRDIAKIISYQGRRFLS